ncbi:MAG: carbohydrate binding family 9 domain-containing protein [Bacteroidetes bacterium]|nr:carbohydrate binding family 9 domain-containing protein [Bacteroidota bacterium]
MTKGVFIPAFIALFLYSQQVFTKSDIPPVIISKINKEIKFDGLPFEKVWNEIEPFPVVMFQPDFGNEPTEKTEIRLFYNDKYLYVSGRLYDSVPSKIMYSSKKRDDYSVNSDGFGIILDTFNDNENALSFSTTPAGIRTDMSIFNDAVGRSPVNISWDTFWDVKTVINEEGWFVEMRIPISSLRFQDVNGVTTMGLIVWRFIPHKNEAIVFPAIHPRYGDWAMIKPSEAEDVIFNGIKSKKPVYIAPYGLAGFSETNELNEAETEYINTKDPTYEAGINIKYGLTGNLTMDLTLNTDFAQVEADDQIINLTRFSLFFPEKRKFFQERASIFSFNLGGPNNLFYSRRIGIHDGKPVRIYGGARIVGRVGPWDLGFIDMQTAPVEDLPSENFGVLRIRRQVINENSYVGGMFTSRIGMDGTYNTAYGIDGIFRVFGDDYLNIKFARSFETGLKNNPVSLDPAKIQISWERRNEEGFAYDVSLSRSGEAFNPGIGFEIREDYSNVRTQFQYGWLPGKKSKLFSHSIYIRQMYFRSVIDGSLETLEAGPGWKFQTKSMMTGNLSLNYMIEDVKESFSFSDDAEVPVGRYEFLEFESMVSTPATRKFYSIILSRAGGFYDGYRVSISFIPTWSISPSLQLSGTYQYNRIKFENRSQKFTGQIIRLKVLYMYNTKLSVSTFVQVNSSNNTIISNFRLRYNPKEGNDFYLVFNEGRNTNPDKEIPELPQISNRTILVKYTYTFNL